MFFIRSKQKLPKKRRFEINNIICRKGLKPSKYSCLKVISLNDHGNKYTYYYHVVSIVNINCSRSISNTLELKYYDVTDYAKEHFPEYLI